MIQHDRLHTGNLTQQWTMDPLKMHFLLNWKWGYSIAMVDDCWLSGGIAWIVWFIPLQLCVFPGPCNKWSHFEYPYRFLMFFSWLVRGASRPDIYLNCHLHVQKLHLSLQWMLALFWKWNHGITDPRSVEKTRLGGGNSKIFGIFTPKLGEDEPSLTSIFFRWGLVQPPG